MDRKLYLYTLTLSTEADFHGGRVQNRKLLHGDIKRVKFKKVEY
jgi:hypothetical protein